MLQPSLIPDFRLGWGRGCCSIGIWQVGIAMAEEEFDSLGQVVGSEVSTEPRVLDCPPPQLKTCVDCKCHRKNDRTRLGVALDAALRALCRVAARSPRNFGSPGG